MNEAERLWHYKQRHGDYKATFGTPEGIRVLADLRLFCLYDRTVEGTTPERTHVNIGQRNAFLHIQACMNEDPERLEQLVGETESE